MTTTQTHLRQQNAGQQNFQMSNAQYAPIQMNHESCALRQQNIHMQPVQYAQIQMNHESCALLPTAHALPLCSTLISVPGKIFTVASLHFHTHVHI